jgi:hypothetical protein
MPQRVRAGVLGPHDRLAVFVMHRLAVGIRVSVLDVVWLRRYCGRVRRFAERLCSVALAT